MSQTSYQLKIFSYVCIIAHSTLYLQDLYSLSAPPCTIATAAEEQDAQEVASLSSTATVAYVCFHNSKDSQDLKWIPALSQWL